MESEPYAALIGLGICNLAFFVGCAVRETVPDIVGMDAKVKRMRIAQAIWLSGLLALVIGIVLCFIL